MYLEKLKITSEEAPECSEGLRLSLEGWLSKIRPLIGLESYFETFLTSRFLGQALRDHLRALAWKSARPSLQKASFWSSVISIGFNLIPKVPHIRGC